MLSKTAEYSLRAIAALAASHPQSLPADDLATQTQIPRRYLHRVLGDLTSAGFVTARRGPGGGYGLAADSATLTILDILNAVAPVPRIHECPLGLPSHVNLCRLHRELDNAYATVEAAFARVTIRDLLESESGLPTPPLCRATCQGG